MDKDFVVFNKATILVTGGTGTVGRFFIDSLLKSNCSFKEIRVFSRDEKKQFDMRNSILDKRIKYFIGDVRDISSIMVAMKDVDYVLHTAALKHVSAMEEYPLEAVKTNILGTDNVLSVAIENRVKKFVCVSTDKAVYPVNAMGMSKALMEKVVLSKRMQCADITEVICVRLGNVLGSRGSVVPLFLDKLLDNREIMVTGENMTRFVMTVDEAVELIEYAFSNGRTGQMIVKKMDACDIKTMANVMVDLFGKTSTIIKIGEKRQGEKEHEKLLSEEEAKYTYTHNGYYIVSEELLDGNISEKEIDSATIDLMSYDAIREKLLRVDCISEALQSIRRNYEGTVYFE